MIPATYNYVYFSAGAHQRQPTRSGPGGFTPIQSYPGPTLSTGDTFAAPPPPATQEVGATTFVFSFMTVAGGSLIGGGPVAGVTSFDRMKPPKPVVVGNTPINVLVVYVPTRGGGSGATIDQFDQTTGTLINDTFVTVAPDQNGSVTKKANLDGYVDTTTSAEAITALPTTSPTGVDFVGWVNLGPPATMSTSPTLSVAKGEAIWALAFYQAPPANLGTISGTISEDTEGGMFQLGGAVISAQPGGTTKSNGDGTYVLTNLKPGTVQLSVTHPLTTQAHATVTVIAGETITEDFVLVRLGTPA